MNIKNLEKVIELTDKLNALIKKHDHLKLMRSGKNARGYTEFVRIGVGGDHYGNGEYDRIVIPLTQCKQAVDTLTIEIDKIWSKIVSVRFELRELGVDMESDGQQKAPHKQG